jgi:hypothetical protein
MRRLAQKLKTKFDEDRAAGSPGGRKTAKPRFTHTPLGQPEDFRVISLNDKSRKQGQKLREPLEFHVEILSLASYVDDSNAQQIVKPFDALSYAWVDNLSLEDTKLIYIDSCPFEIRNNLHSALVNIFANWYLDRIWVDQICINQEDIPEKNQQVALMSKIYKSANEVHIWLGTLDKTLMKPTQALLRYFNLAWPRSISIAETLYLVPKDRSQSDTWEAALSSICERQWFQRTWTFEELILARYPVLWIGHLSTPWHVFAYGIRKALALFESVAPKIQGWNPVLDTVAIWELATVHKNGGIKSPSFTDYLIVAGQRNTKNRLDKVFGIHGLLDHSVSSLITVNYKSSVVTVYENAMRYSIDVDKDLGLLASAGVWRNESRRTPELTLPSWVPDFSDLRKPVNYVFTPLRRNTIRVSCKSTSAGSGRIRLRGFVLGRIGNLPAFAEGASFVGWEGVGSKYNDVDKTTVEPIPPCAINVAGACLYDIEDLFDPDRQLQVGNLRSLTRALAVHNENEEKCHECLVCNPHDYPTKLPIELEMLHLPFCVVSGDWLCLFQGTRLPSLLRPKSGQQPSGHGIAAESTDAERDAEPQFELVSTCFPMLIPRDDLRYLEEESLCESASDKGDDFDFSASNTCVRSPKSLSSQGQKGKDHTAVENMIEGRDWIVAREWRNAFSCVCVDILLV